MNTKEILIWAAVAVGAYFLWQKFGKSATTTGSASAATTTPTATPATTTAQANSIAQDITNFTPAFSSVISTASSWF